MGTLNDVKMPSLNDKIVEKATVAETVVKTKKVVSVKTDKKLGRNK